MGRVHPVDKSIDGRSVLSIPSMNDLDTQNRRHLDPGAFNKNFELLEIGLCSCISDESVSLYCISTVYQNKRRCDEMAENVSFRTSKQSFCI